MNPSAKNAIIKKKTEKFAKAILFAIIAAVVPSVITNWMSKDAMPSVNESTVNENKSTSIDHSGDEFISKDSSTQYINKGSGNLKVNK